MSWLRQTASACGKMILLHSRVYSQGREFALSCSQWGKNQITHESSASSLVSCGDGGADGAGQTISIIAQFLNDQQILWIFDQND